MTIHEQLAALRQAVAIAESELNSLRCSIDRKVRAPPPDGSTDNLVNATTDVLPRIEYIRGTLLTVLAEVEPINYEPAKSFAEKPTLANANAWLKFKRIGRIVSRDGEYRVRYWSLPTTADYYTNDLSDAFSTACFEHERSLASRK